MSELRGVIVFVLVECLLMLTFHLLLTYSHQTLTYDIKCNSSLFQICCSVTFKKIYCINLYILLCDSACPPIISLISWLNRLEARPKYGEWESWKWVSTLAQLAWIQSSAVRMKGLIMCAGPLTVPFRWEQQLLGVAAHWGHHLLPFTMTVRLSVGGTDSDWASVWQVYCSSFSLVVFYVK